MNSAKMTWILLATVLALAGIGTSCRIRTGGSADDQAAGEERETRARERLEALPYITWHKVSEEERAFSGVTLHDASLACSGVNLFRSQNLDRSFLMDMSGTVVHSLQGRVQVLKPLRNGEFLFVGGKVGRIAWDSEVVWQSEPLGAHHDVNADENGDIYTLLHHRVLVPELSTEIPIDDTPLLQMSPEGRVIKQLSVARLVLQSGRRQLLEKVFAKETARDARRRPRKPSKRSQKRKRRGLDILHTNTVEIIPRDVFSGDRRLFKKGDILISIRKINTIAVVDMEREEIVWSWGPEQIEGQHQPTLLENDNFLIFDNGSTRKFSRVIELNPRTEEIEWEYKADPPESFYTFGEGGAQRLPNGNTLITESNKGHAFEVTPEGAMVWEYWNPEIKDDKRAGFYRFMRIVDFGEYPELRDFSGCSEQVG